MSKIALSGSASGSGTFTLAAPNSDSSYTLTLPAVSGGTLVSTDASGNVGIGTNSPGKKLSVVASGTDGIRVAQVSAAAGNDPIVELYHANNYGFRWRIDNNNADLHLDANTAGTYTNDVLTVLRTSGVVGIGVTPAGTAGKLDVIAAATGNQYSGVQTRAAAVGNGDGSTTVTVVRAVNSGGNQWANAVYTASSHLFNYGGSATVNEAMRIDSSGNLLVKKTSDDLSTPGFCASVQSSTFNGVSMIKGGGTWGTNLFVGRTASAGTGAYVEFWYNGTTNGTITTNGSTTSYNTSSDYRLKENIQPMQNALAVVQQLNPVTYTWKADGSDGQGFIAHELQAVVPDCVTGEKDAVDEEGNPVYQGIDTSFLVATLTKAIQEQQEQINQLKAEIATLKSA